MRVKSFEYLVAEINHEFQVVAVHDRNFPFGPTKKFPSSVLIECQRRTWEDGTVEEFHSLRSFKEAGLFEEFADRKPELFSKLGMSVSEARDSMLRKSLRVGGIDKDGFVFYANADPSACIPCQFSGASVMPMGNHEENFPHTC